MPFARRVRGRAARSIETDNDAKLPTQGGLAFGSDSEWKGEWRGESREELVVQASDAGRLAAIDAHVGLPGGSAPAIADACPPPSQTQPQGRGLFFVRAEKLLAGALHFPTTTPNLQPPSRNSNGGVGRTASRLPIGFLSTVIWGRPMNWATNSVAGRVVESWRAVPPAARRRHRARRCDRRCPMVLAWSWVNVNTPAPHRRRDRAQLGPQLFRAGWASEVAQSFIERNTCGRRSRARSQGHPLGAAAREIGGRPLAQLTRAQHARATLIEARAEWWPRSTPAGSPSPAKGFGAGASRFRWG